MLHTVQDKKGGGASKETEGKAALQAKMKELESKLTERVTKDRERKMALRYRKVSRESGPHPPNGDDQRRAGGVRRE